MSNKCISCPRSCRTDRTASTGYCGVGNNFKIARAELHHWEEPCISGSNGSGTVFFSGCNLKCVYCQNYELSHQYFGKEISDQRLVEIFDELIEKGAHNINLVNPTHYADKLIEVLQNNKPAVPVVYNTSGYEKVETLQKLRGLVDIYLTDIKYIDSSVSLKYSGAGDYFAFAQNAVKEMRNQQPEDVFDDKGIMQKGVIFRNMILPGNISQSIKVIDFISESFSNEAIVSLMSQYTPCGEAEDFPTINRRISKREYDTVLNHLIDRDFENAFVQELSSAKEEYIPPFDLTGVDFSTKKSL